MSIITRTSLQALICFAATGAGLEAYAACTPQSGFRTIDVPMNMGRVVVRPSDEVGKVLKRASFLITPNGEIGIRCTNQRTKTIRAVLNQGYPASTDGSINVFQTNIPGIGIRLYRRLNTSPNGNYSDFYPYSVTTSLQASSEVVYLGAGFFEVEIIKIAAQTGSGALNPGRYSTYYEQSLPSSPFLTSTVYGNAITIASSSCEISGGQRNKVVQLPTVSRSDFSGVGSTVGEKQFDINIVCNGGASPSGYSESNNISLDFDFALVNGTNDVLINQAPRAVSAQGVGIQMVSKYKNANQTIKKGEKIELGTVKSNDVLSYNVPIVARYYQTEETIRPGKVSSLATFTIQYD